MKVYDNLNAEKLAAVRQIDEKIERYRRWISKLETDRFHLDPLGKVERPISDIADLSILHRP